MDYEVEQLQHLLDNDPEFVSLIKEANNFSVSRFPEWCASLNVLRTHVPAFIILPIEEFYAQFKCMAMWAVTMGRILTKIHGTDKYDESKAFPVGLNGNKNALLYYEDKLSFFIDKMALRRLPCL